MPTASNSHVGILQEIRMTGFGVFSNLDGVYVLDLTLSEQRVYRRQDNQIEYDLEDQMWILRTGEGAVVARHGTRRYSPEGDWDDNKRVVSGKDNGSIVAMLAFPAPRLDLDFYSTNGVSQIPLLKHPNLIMLQIHNRERERIPTIFHRYKGAKFTILYSHGNGEDLGLLVDELAALSKSLKANVFGYDYVGYSTSKLEGCAPSEKGCIRSIRAAWEFLVTDLQISPESIVLYGRSIGSGPTIDLASRPFCRDSIAGVILQSPILSGGSVLLGPSAGQAARPFDIFTNYAKIGRVNRPVAVMHGTNDEVVPLVNGQRLSSLCVRPYQPFWIDGHGHNDMPPNLCDDYALRFLTSLQIPPPGQGDRDIEELFSKCRADATRASLNVDVPANTKECCIS
mmetsp:Transcript_37715/g.48816  ORF Transcript_37715/g.48816 Transcript_37715/m.48816 type:complete len:397 (-) Transcript_37715:146-1336(-)